MRRIELGLLVLALFGLGGITGLPAQAAQPTYCESNAGSPSDLKELKHGLLQGYLDPKTLPDSLKLLAHPPAPGSAAQALDEAIAKANFSFEGTARWSQAATDADLHFPAAASIFPEVWASRFPKNAHQGFTHSFADHSPMRDWRPTEPRTTTNDQDRS